MGTIFMSTENRKTNEPRRFRLTADTRSLKGPNKNVALANLSIYYTWKNIKSAYNNSKFKISAPTWNDEFDLLDGSYSISDIQEYFEYTIKRHETIADNLLVQIYINKIKNRIVFKIKTGYKLELLPPETMKLLGSTKKDVDQDKDGEDAPMLESVEVALVHYNLVNKNYQQASKVLFLYQINNLDSQFTSFINNAEHNKHRISIH